MMGGRVSFTGRFRLGSREKGGRERGGKIKKS
jgi:hypothetical protein